MTNIPMTERVFYSDKFDSLEDEQKKEAIADLDAVFENDIKVLPPEKQAIARETYQRDKETKLSEMGYDNLLTPKLETNIEPSTLMPETKEEALTMSAEAPKEVARMKQLEQFRQQDQPLEDQTLMFAFPASGAIHAAKGAIVGSRAAIRSGVAVGKAETAAEVGAQLASKGIEEFTSDEFKEANPNYYMAMQLLGTLVTAGTLGTVVYNKTIQRYDKVSSAVKEGKITLQQAEEAITDANKIADEAEIAEIQKHLEDTAPEKVSTVKPTKDIPIEEAEGLFIPPEAIGATLGFKQNEDGTFTYDTTTGLLGAVGARVAKKALTNKQVQQFIKESLDELPQATNRAVKKLTGVDMQKGITDTPVFTHTMYSSIKPDKLGNRKLKQKVHLKDGSRLSGMTDDNTFYGYTKNGEQFTIKKNNVKRSDIIQDTEQGKQLYKYLDDRSPLTAKEEIATKEKPKGFLERKKALTQSKIDKGLIPESGRRVKHPRATSGYYFLGDSGKVWFEARGKWFEMPNKDVAEEVNYIAKNGLKKFKEKENILDDSIKKANIESEQRELKKKDSYKMDHKAPDSEHGVGASNLKDAFGDDIYTKNASRYYGHGNKTMDDESIKIIQSVKNKPDADVTIYRAIPKDINVKINPDDWVTTSKTYAKEHGEGPLNGNYKILEMKVKAKDLYTDGNSIHEWGWSPKGRDDGMIAMSSPTLSGGALGASAGVEIDEDGNIGYNLAKGAIGAVGGAVAYKGGSKLYDMYKNKSIKIPDGQLPPETKIQIWQRIMQDKFNRIKQLQKVKAGSEKISDELDIYRAEERYSGRTQYRIDEFQKERVDPLLKFIASKNINIDDIDSYLHARHAFERNAQMKKVSGIENGSGMSNAEAAEIIKKFKDDKNMNDVVNSINKISKDRLRLIKKEGLESEEFIADIENLYKNYVPLKRDMSDKFQQQGSGSGKGFSIKGKETKRAKGSQRKVESPFMHTILDYQETLTRAEKNKVGQTFLKFTEQFPDKDLYEVESLKYMPKYDKDGNITSVDPLYKTGDNIFHVKVDGKIKQIELKDEGLAVALKNLNPSQMNGITKVMHKATRFLAALNTQYNPEFVVGNFERDLQAAMINLPKEMKPKYASFLKDVPKAVKGIYRNERGKELTDEYQKLFDELKSEGGTTGWMEQYEVPELKADLEKTIRKYQGKDLPSNAFKSVLNYIDDVNTSVENGVRLVAYKQAKDAGLTKKEAASIAKNLTVNFNRKGTAGTTINAAYMFYNASIQGSVRMLKALKDSKRAKGLVAGITGLSYGLHQYNNMQNEEAYSKIPQFEKDTNYILMNKDGSYQKVKVPYGYNVFKTFGDVIAEVQDGQLDLDEAKSRAFSTIVNAFSPIGASSDPVTTLVPTVAKPFYEMKTNENFFGGKIKPEANPFQPEKLAESHRSYKSVNPIAKKFTQELNELTGGTKHVRGEIDVSPEYVEHLVEFVGGGLAKLASRTTTSIDKAIKGEEQDVNKIPFYRLFVGKVREKADIHESYNLYKESSRKILSDYKSEKFNKSIDSAIRNKEIDAKKGFRLKKKFKDNQIRVKWSKAKGIQSTKDGQKNIKSLIQSGGSKTDIKNILLNKEK